MDRRTLLRSRTADRHGRVDFAELFFDLVFVFAVTQISHLLLERQDLAHAAESAFLLLSMWAVWVYTTWGVNWLDTSRAQTRLMLFAMMGGGLVLAASIPQAFDDRGLFFAGAYALMQNGRNAFMLRALQDAPANERRSFERIQLWLAASGALWICGGLAEGQERWALWGLALVLEMGSPWVGFWVPGMGRSVTGDWRVDPDHIAERCGLFIIIALGESVILIRAAFADAARWDPRYVGVVAVAFVGAIAMWWIYFANIASGAHARFAHHADPGQIARAGYTYAHIPIVAGIVLTAVGNEIMLAHPFHQPDLPTTAILVGGPLRLRQRLVPCNFWQAPASIASDRSGSVCRTGPGSAQHDVAMARRKPEPLTCRSRCVGDVC